MFILAIRIFECKNGKGKKYVPALHDIPNDRMDEVILYCLKKFDVCHKFNYPISESGFDTIVT